MKFQKKCIYFEYNNDIRIDCIGREEMKYGIIGHFNSNINYIYEGSFY